MEVKRGLRNSILLPTLTYGSETWTWNRAHQSRVHAIEMCYLRVACGVTRWEGESNESVNERCIMEACASGVKCGVVEQVQRNTLRQLGHILRMNNEEFVKKVYVSEIRVPLEGAGLEHARRECLDRERWRLFCCGHPFGGRSQRERGVRAIHTYIDRQIENSSSVVCVC